MHQFYNNYNIIYSPLCMYTVVLRTVFPCSISMNSAICLHSHKLSCQSAEDFNWWLVIIL